MYVIHKFMYRYCMQHLFFNKYQIIKIVVHVKLLYCNNCVGILKVVAHICWFYNSFKLKFKRMRDRIKLFIQSTCTILSKHFNDISMPACELNS